MEFSEMMFYAEAEGLLPTRAGKINAAINIIKNDPRPYIDSDEIKEIIENQGIDFNSLSRREVKYINAMIGG